MIVSTEVSTPLGRVALVADDAALRALHLPGGEAPPARADVVALAAPAAHPVLARTAAQLAEYFAGARTTFALPLAPAGTPWQQAVWREVAAIPCGETRSYGALARALGAPGASRAVGAANGANPLAIVVPCHRVVGARGALTGYAGGLAAKRWLLAHEARLVGGAALPLWRAGSRC